MTQARLANLAGCHKGYLSLIESGQKGPPSDELLERLEHALGLAPGELLTAARWQSLPDAMQDEFERLRTERRMAHRLVELLGDQSFDSSGRVAGALERARRTGELRRLLAAFGGSRVDQDELPMEVPILGDPPSSADYLKIPGVNDPDAYAVRIDGDSMVPDYCPDDLVVFSPAAEAHSGADCLARLDGATTTVFRRVYFERDDRGVERIRLQPINSSYPPIVVKRDRLVGLHVAVSVTRCVAPSA